MSNEPYLDGVSALHALTTQTEQAVQDAQVQPGAVKAVQQMRAGDEALADGRDRMIAAVTRSKESLQSMGLQGLRDGGDRPTPANGSCADADQALSVLECLASEATRLSVAQANAVSEHRRLVAAAGKAEAAEKRQAAEERRLAAEAKSLADREAREQAERERQDQARRDADRRRLREQLKDLQGQRDLWTRKIWRPSKKRELARLDAEMADVRTQIGRV